MTLLEHYELMNRHMLSAFIADVDTPEQRLVLLAIAYNALNTEEGCAIGGGTIEALALATRLSEEKLVSVLRELLVMGIIAVKPCEHDGIIIKVDGLMGAPA